MYIYINEMPCRSPFSVLMECHGGNIAPGSFPLSGPSACLSNSLHLPGFGREMKRIKCLDYSKILVVPRCFGDFRGRNDRNTYFSSLVQHSPAMYLPAY